MTSPQPKRLIWVVPALAFVIFGFAGPATQVDGLAQEATKIVVEATATSILKETAIAPAVPEPQVLGEAQIAGPTTTQPAPVTPTAPPAPTRPDRAELTPAQLADRRLDTFDALDPPIDDVFVSTVESPAPLDVIARSTWNPECPVSPADLSYAQVSFYGFDGRFHTGELLLHSEYADDIVGIFARLHEMRFPIEEMRVVSLDDFANPIATENNTTVFTCRRSVSSSRWSRHAHGDAIDINPFHNPYVSNSRVIPELATAYVDRDREVPGLINAEVRAMFSEIGWGWGGNWNSVKDWMHFSATGR